jgi:molybdopterin-guanine dinucleotide biosynthesis protein A
MARRPPPIGAILAGGLGARLGGSKAIVELHGKPLICYPVEAVHEALGEVAIVVKPDTELPSLPGVTVWVEPGGPHHPLVGIIHALENADGRPVLVCAADLPFVTAKVVRRIARARPGSALAVVAYGAGQVQPLLGCYQQRALEALQRIDLAAEPALRDIIAALGPRLVHVGDPQVLFNVNAPEDLLHAAAILDGRRRR